MEKIVLVGGGGHARILVDLIVSAGVYEITGIIDTDLQKGAMAHGYEVLGNDSVLEEVFRNGTVNACIAVGSVRDNKVRKRLYGNIINAGYRCPPLVHPKAILGGDVLMGNGVQVMAGVILQTGVKIGNNTIINTGSIVDHDCVIGDHVHVGPGAVMSGGCRIGSGAFIGVGSTIIQGLRIGEDALVTAGSVVVKDVEDGQIVRGIQNR